LSHSVAEQQNRLHQDITRYINGSVTSPTQRLGSLLWPTLPYKINANGIISQFRDISPKPQDGERESVTISVPEYQGDNRYVQEMIAALAPLQKWLCGAYVHGSLATEDEILYSDFDALIILRDSVFESPRVLSSTASKFSRLQKIMNQHDPLQHHGWFVLTQNDLQWYCDAYFPAELFRYSRSLLPDLGREVCLYPRGSAREYTHAFSGLTNAVLRHIEAEQRQQNAYALKGALSRIMLLPALYLQAKDGTAVYKKYSFDLARKDFPPKLWAVMDEISAIRADWKYDTAGLGRRLLANLTGSWRRLAIRWWAPAASASIIARLDEEFWSDTKQLILAMQTNIAEKKA